jgi:serine/threonine protein kinase
MKDGLNPERETLSADALARIEKASWEFEAAWKRGEQPSIEAALGSAAGAERAKLLWELLLLDLDYRRRQGEVPRVESYLAKFRADAGVIESVFAAQEAASSFSGGGSLAQILGDTRSVDPRSLLGTSIGPYKLLQVLGEGGMGLVYAAEQTQPVRRSVALKVIKLGMDTKEVIARFEAERQALALMNHPNIARVLDAGSTPDGRPFFVMEYVPGEPITSYSDRQKLSTKERLELFVQVCDAVQHAHQKAIIHRDLKPSNVLVMVQDGKPLPKIIDFGVAKATNQRLTEKAVFTELGQIIGTPEYMSPEQAEMGATDIDTRTDIYSLGVLLYELLVGELPFDSGELRQAGYAEIQRIIREEEPPKPSTRLSHLTEGSKKVAERRKTDLVKLLREIRGDLDWITMKALEKDRVRRYGTPGGPKHG